MLDKKKEFTSKIKAPIFTSHDRTMMLVRRRNSAQEVNGSSHIHKNYSVRGKAQDI